MMGFSKYDKDPEALAWARSKVQDRIDRYRDFERRSTEAEKALRWRRLANMLQMEFIGGEGCVIAAFDERRPVVAEAWEQSKEAGK